MAKKMHPNEKELRDFAMGYPETREDFPWGHRAVKVRGKVFLFMSYQEEGLSLSVKLTGSHEFSLTLPFTAPTHYGMGKHGWVTATFEKGEQVPTPLLEEWIDESFRNIAPVKVVKALDGGAAPTAAKPKAKAKKKVAKKKTTAKKKVAKKPVAKKTAKKKAKKKA